jgi:hypothetical protein
MNHCIDICRWSDDINVLDNEKIVKILSTHCSTNQRVEEIANRFLSYRSQNKVDKSYQNKIELVKQYIFHEITGLVCGIHYNQIHYKSMYYSGSEEHLSNFAKDEKSLFNLIQDISTKDEFKDVFDQIVENTLAKSPKVSGFIGIVV